MTKTLFGQFPNTRLRRLRQTPWIRDLVAETQLTVNDLILPMFLRHSDAPKDIPPMPGTQRYSLDELPALVAKVSKLKIPAVALFPLTPENLKDVRGSEATNMDNLICQAIRVIKSENPNLGVIADVALDPYTDHGHDGVVHNGVVVNDESVQVLCKQALALAKSGVDVIAPSDMMDGRIGAIRQTLDEHGFENVLILSYAAKYASSFYGPFRAAVGAATLTAPSDKKTYQMDPRNLQEAIRETALDIQEGADVVMVKPGLPYLDVILHVSQAFNVPVFAYQVTGEYAMIKAAAQNGWVDGKAVMMECVLAMKRAGAQAILTYAAMEIAEELSK